MKKLTLVAVVVFTVFTQNLFGGPGVTSGVTPVVTERTIYSDEVQEIIVKYETAFFIIFSTETSVAELFSVFEDAIEEFDLSPSKSIDTVVSLLTSIKDDYPKVYEKMQTVKSKCIEYFVMIKLPGESLSVIYLTNEGKVLLFGE